MSVKMRLDYQNSITKRERDRERERERERERVPVAASVSHMNPVYSSGQSQ